MVLVWLKQNCSTFPSLETEKGLNSQNSEPWSWGCYGFKALTLRSCSPLCLFSAHRPQFDCSCCVAQSTHQRAVWAFSSLPLEGALQSKLQTMQGKWFLFYWEYKTFYQNPFTAWLFFFITVSWEMCDFEILCRRIYMQHLKFYWRSKPFGPITVSVIHQV